jgi:hypothetical protein
MDRGWQKRGRGRPALEPGAASVNLHVRVSSAQYDAAYAQATAARLPLASYVRQVLRAAVLKGRDQ